MIELAVVAGLAGLDYVAIGAAITAAAAAVKVFVPARSEIHKVDEVVDGDVLAQFLGLTDRVAHLELDLAALRLELIQTQEHLATAETQLREMLGVEHMLRTSLEEKDVEVQRLRARVRHLEDLLNHEQGE